jgi:hypothetical protein
MYRQKTFLLYSETYRLEGGSSNAHIMDQDVTLREAVTCVSNRFLNLHADC